MYNEVCIQVFITDMYRLTTSNHNWSCTSHTGSDGRTSCSGCVGRTSHTGSDGRTSCIVLVVLVAVVVMIVLVVLVMMAVLVVLPTKNASRWIAAKMPIKHSIPWENGAFQ